MPIVLNYIENDCRILIWETVESVDELLKNVVLTPAEDALIQTFKSEKRLKEYLSVRMALQLTLGKETEIRYNPYGKPEIGASHLSISHSAGFIALLISRYNCGIDIEEIRESITKISPRFLSANEAAMAQSVIQKHIGWGAKEVVFKIHGIGNLDFRKEIELLNIPDRPSGNISALLKKEGYESSYTIHYLQWQHFMVAWGFEK